MNVVVIRGALSSAPQARFLPSGDRLGTFEVTVRTPDLPAESVPVVWFNPPDPALRLHQGAQVVVAGRVRRRFYRTPAGTRSRTEVVAAELLSAGGRVRVAGLLDAVVATLTDDA